MSNSKPQRDEASSRGARTLAATVLCLVLAACGGHGGGGDAPPDTSDADTTAFSSFAAAKVTLEPPSVNCPYGGSRIESGRDANANGTLDAGEVSGVQYACHGAPGGTGATGALGATGASGGAGTASLVRIDTEPAGMNCASGGAKVSAGIDASRNGVLEAGEVTSTRYVCSGSAGANGSNGSNGTNGANGTNGLTSLLAITTEAAGANCTDGGLKVTSGMDANRNSVLDAGEVTSTHYLCHGAPSAGLAWIDVTGTSEAMVVNARYLAHHASAQVVLTLPGAPSLGDTVAVSGAGFGGWKIAQNAGQFITARNLPHDQPAGAAWQASGSGNNWDALAPSADGNKLVVASFGFQLHTSADGGTTWTPRETNRQWSGVASSADGSKLVAGVVSGPLYTSTDSGATWTARASSRSWRAVASSADGSKLVAGTSGGQLYTSTDAGLNWTAREASRDWYGVASSADGNKLVAAAFGGQLYTSTDAGVNWTARESNRDWISVASSSDGNKLVAVARNGQQVYTSTDAGVNWTARESARDWMKVASSADGDKLIAAEFGGQLYVSTDAGASWVARESSRLWRGVATSADGSKLFASVAGQVYRSFAGRSSAGAAGAVSGGLHDSLTLQYAGNGEWVAIEHALTGPLHIE